MLLPVLKNFSIASGIGFDYRFQWDQGAPGGSLPYNLSNYTASLAITNYDRSITYKTLVSGVSAGSSGIFYGGATNDPTNGIIDIVLTGSDIAALPFQAARYTLTMTPSGGQPIWLLYGNFNMIGAATGPSAPTLLPQLNLTQVAADNFNRANGTLAGSNNWLATSEGSMNIASNEAIGTANTPLGNYRTGETYNSNQYAQVAVGSVPLVSGGYIGLSVRNQDASNNYTGIYFNNGGSYQLILYKKVGGSYVQIGPVSGAAAFVQGTVLQLVAEGSQITFTIPSQPAVGAVSVTDTTFTGGVPGIESVDANSMDNWVGGNAATAPLSSAIVSDNFNRANGGVSVGQSNWQVMTYSPAIGATVDAPIVSNQIDYTATNVHAGDTRTDTFNSNQWASIQEGTVAMNSSGFTGVTCRCQNGGRSGYLGVFFQNNSYAIIRLDGTGNPGSDTSHIIAVAGTSGNDPAGTTYTLVAQGSRISFRVNGCEILSVVDSTYTGGAPGLMMFGTASADNWSAGNN